MLSRAHTSIVFKVSLILFMAVISTEAGAAPWEGRLLLSINRDTFLPGDTMELSVGVRAPGEQQDVADVYLAMVVPSGDFFCFKRDLTVAGPDIPYPLAKGWQVTNVPTTPVLAVTIPEGALSGDYAWGLVLAKAGADVLVPDNWIASASINWKIEDANETGAIEYADKPRDLSPLVSQDQLNELVRDNTEFAFDLYRRLRLEQGNLLFSPYSVSLALSMAYAGARNKTASQMASALHFDTGIGVHRVFNALDLALESSCVQQDDDNQTKFCLEIANSLWGQRGHHFLQGFLNILSENYGAGMRLVDFKSDPEGSRQQINTWVASETYNKIQNLIPPGAIDQATKLILANAVYFKAGWLYQFDEAATHKGRFHLADGREETVSMMSQIGWFDYGAGTGYEPYQAVELPYYGGRASMLILLPYPNAFDRFERDLSRRRLDEILGGLSRKRVRIIMPRFRFDWGSKSLRNALESMGMIYAFNPRLADFSGMDGAKDLFISDVFHKAFIAVDEKGTEAAAATAVTIGLTSVPSNPSVEINLNRPFIFIIRDNVTGTVLFIGRVSNPG